MHRDNDIYRSFSRRAVILFGGKMVLFAGLAGRMYYLQVIESDRYKTLSDDNRISLKLLAPSRGRIVDRFGRPLAINRQNYRVMLTAEKSEDVIETLEALAKIIPISGHERQRLLRETKRRRRFRPVIIRENLEWRDVARIEVNAPELSGISIDVGESRFYPDGFATANILGYVAVVSEKDRDADPTNDPLLELPGFRIGKAGMEKVHDISLRGKSGTSQIEVNALGREIRELERAEGIPGDEAWLSIDLELQKFVTKRLAQEAASAVVLDIFSGEVLAMASTPSFDPNAFNRGLTRAEWKALIVNPRSPLSNKAIAGQYAPGSTFKMVVALAALEKGVINPRSQVFCSGKTVLGNATFHCWKRTGHGTMNLLSGITNSCDSYFYEIARRTGIDRISAMARRLGMGELLNIELSGEKPGLMPTRKWKKKTKGVSWQQGETLLAGIGQGLILATPLQLAVMTARLANGGKAVSPTLTRRIVPFNAPQTPLPELPEVADIGLHPTHLKIILNGMAMVTNSPMGTAYKSRIKDPKFRMAGKTGTVQVRRISKQQREKGLRKNKDKAWIERDHALFVGFAPVSSPRYAVSVVIEHGGGGSSTAAPVARDILTEVQRRDSSRGRSAALRTFKG